MFTNTKTREPLISWKFSRKILRDENFLIYEKKIMKIAKNNENFKYQKKSIKINKNQRASIPR